MKEKLHHADIEALQGMELDREIAERIGLEIVGMEDGVLWVREGVRNFPFSPTSDWSQLGPLLEAEEVALFPTMARGSGAGQIAGCGWMGNATENYMKTATAGPPFVDTHALTAGSRALLNSLVLYGQKQ